MIEFTAEVLTPDGPMRGKIALYPGPTHLAELIPPVQALADGLISLARRREEKQGRRISCGPKCGACCRQMTPLSIPEAFYLQDLVAALPPARKQTVCRRFEETFKSLETTGITARLHRPDTSDDENLVIARDYLALGLPCPFLEEESCSIYPARPLACREYLVTSPAEWCARPFDHQLARVKYMADLPVVLAYLTADLLSEPARLIPLTLALHWAIENKNLHRRTWPGRQLFEKFLAKFNERSHHGAHTAPTEE